jgi:hypothetical protein
MASGRFISGILLITALAATPAFAQDGQRRRGSDHNGDGRARAYTGERAVPRDAGRHDEAEHDRNWHAQNQAPLHSTQPNRVYVAPNRAYVAPNRYYGSRAVIVPRTVIVPRVIRPSVVTVVPYQPYIYRPHLSLGVFYGAGGVYPYGYTPPEYFQPMPGRVYGGLRITGAPREAQVFADGYYVGIVNDFDGVFQHLNLEAGPHNIEVEIPGYDRVAFNVMIQPGRTMTLRADVPY